MKKEMMESEDVEEFEKVFRNAWKVAKEKGLDKGVEEEINGLRKEKRGLG